MKNIFKILKYFFKGNGTKYQGSEKATGASLKTEGKIMYLDWEAAAKEYIFAKIHWNNMLKICAFLYVNGP